MSCHQIKTSYHNKKPKIKKLFPRISTHDSPQYMLWD